MPFAAQVEKDRRSRMAGSSLHQPAKKGGMGSFGWGLAAEFGPEDMQTCFPREATVAPSKVTVAPASQSTMAPRQSSWTMPEMMDDVEFPALSPKSGVEASDTWGFIGTEAASPSEPESSSPSDPTLSFDSASSSAAITEEEASECAQLPSTAFAPAADVSTEQRQPRNASEERFDAQHPQNQFARKPCRAACSQETSETVDGDFVIVNWSSSDTTAVSSAILQQNANSAHLSPYVQPEPPVAHSVLKYIARHSSAKQFHQQPQSCRNRSSSRKAIMNRQPAVRCR
eukprot:TRINITY_DN1291_c0_g1_i7.p1 TRINITY_DN1291_c0_g1~~TRINITY_DN1291_c0_g1_i7.p1  ORF type:complete len:286 (-),score=46.37 TRINITY_DN1291_c0_g1_i7:282-1139(-)